MGKKKNILFILLGILLAVYVLAELARPRTIDWSESYSRSHKIPYGCYILKDMLPEILTQSKITENQKSFYTSAISDTLRRNTSLAVITNIFEPDKTDLHALLHFVSNGNNALVSTMSFGKLFADTLKIKTDYNTDGFKLVQRPLKLQFVNPKLKSATDYSFQRIEPIYFSSFDTLHTTVLGWDSAKHVNFIKIDFGKGAFFLSSTPRVFTNYHLLYSNYDYATKSLSYLKNTSFIWDEYYKPNRQTNKSQSPIRYILSQDSLRYAYYLLMATILLFILFESKRRQRIMPVVIPPVNSSMEFVETVGRLYFSRKDNKDLAEKKINHFYDFILTNYYVKPDETDRKFRQQFAEKLTLPIKTVDQLFDSVQHIRTQNGISDEELMSFIKLIDDVQYKK